MSGLKRTLSAIGLCSALLLAVASQAQGLITGTTQSGSGSGSGSQGTTMVLPGHGNSMGAGSGTGGYFCLTERSTEKRAEVSDTGSSVTRQIYEDAGRATQSCQGTHTRQWNDSLICYDGPLVPDCSNRVEKQYNANPTCPVGTESRNNACWTCPPPFKYDNGKCVMPAGNSSCPPGFDNRDGGCYSCANINVLGASSSYESVGKCKACAGVGPARHCESAPAPRANEINPCPPGSNRVGGMCQTNLPAARSEPVCPPPPATWGSNNLPLSPQAAYARDGRCYAKYCSLTRTPSSSLSCIDKTRTSGTYPGRLVITNGNSATCEVAHGILRANHQSNSACTNPQVGVPRGLSGLYCDTPSNYPTYLKPSHCCLGEDWTTTSPCTMKMGQASTGYYKPFVLDGRSLPRTLWDILLD